MPQAGGARPRQERMSFREILQQQQRGLEFMGSVGVIGLHMVSGPLVGFGIVYGLDYWLDSGPWGKLVFLIIGIGAGFLNVYRDSRQLLRRMARDEARSRAAGEAGPGVPEAGQTPREPRDTGDEEARAGSATPASRPEPPRVGQAPREPRECAAPGHGVPRV